MRVIYVATLVLCVLVAVGAATKSQMHLRHPHDAADPASKIYQAPSEEESGCSRGFAFR